MPTVSRMILLLLLGSAPALFAGCTTSNRTEAAFTRQPKRAVHSPGVAKASTAVNPCGAKAVNPCNPCASKVSGDGEAFDPWGPDQKADQGRAAGSPGAWW